MRTVLAVASCLSQCSRYLLTMAWVAVSVGCASALPEARQLTQSKESFVVHLSEPLVEEYRDKNGILVGVSAVLPGAYISVAENELGTFFQGPEHALWRKEKDQKNAALYRGGIWVPKKAGEKPRVYFHFSTPVSTPSRDDLNSAAIVVPTNVISFAVPRGVSAGPAAVGGALGGAVVAAAVAMAENDIAIFPISRDAEFLRKVEAAFVARALVKLGD